MTDLASASETGRPRSQITRLIAALPRLMRTGKKCRQQGKANVPVVAGEIVLFADLLLRLLDQIEDRKRTEA